MNPCRVEPPTSCRYSRCSESSFNGVNSPLPGAMLRLVVSFHRRAVLLFGGIVRGFQFPKLSNLFPGGALQ